MAHGQIYRAAVRAAVVNAGADISAPDVAAKRAMRDVDVADAVRCFALRS